jgi:hypothetical protein
VTLTNVTVTTANVTNATIATANITTANVTTATIANASVSGNLTFTGTGNRITGDFSNATIANRVMFQTSTVNGNTRLGLLPNGTATTTSQSFFNAADPTNAGFLALSASSSDAAITSGITGTGTYLPMTFFTGGSETARLSATAKTLILSGGDTTANGTGITFPATQSASSDANTLDDYEEGTFTPTAFGGSTAGTTTYSSRSGAYTKIGNQVTVWLYVGVTGMTGTGNLILGGLPFAQNSSGSTLCIGSVFAANLDWAAGLTSPVVIGDASQTSLRLFAVGDNVVWQAITVDNAFELHCSVTYFV